MHGLDVLRIIIFSEIVEPETLILECVHAVMLELSSILNFQTLMY